MHEAKVDVVMVANLSEHLSSSDTTAQDLLRRCRCDGGLRTREPERFRRSA